jgi:hypothetical protein
VTGAVKIEPITLLSGMFLVNRGGPLRSPHSRRGRDAHFDHTTEWCFAVASDARTTCYHRHRVGDNT